MGFNTIMAESEDEEKKSSHFGQNWMEWKCETGAEMVMEFGVGLFCGI